MNKEQKRIQVISMFLNLHTLAKNMKKYVAKDKFKEPVEEEARRLDFYAREIERHNGRDIMREILKGTYVEKS